MTYTLVAGQLDNGFILPLSTQRYRHSGCLGLRRLCKRGTWTSRTGTAVKTVPVQVKPW
jgi:hypothetical protein